MPFVPEEITEKLKQIDLISYLQMTGLFQVVYEGNGRYSTKEHRSLKMDNGMWNWFSKGIVGRNAVDFIMETKDMKFFDALNYLMEQTGITCENYEQVVKNNLPNIRWHDLRHTFATILIKENFNLKAVSKKMGHSKQIITADVYVDKSAITNDCIEELTPFLEEVLPKENVCHLNDFTNDLEIIVDIENLLNELIKNTVEANDLTDDMDELIIEFDKICATI